MDAAYFHHEQTQLQHDIVDALDRAQRGEADTDDWKLIRWACGVSAVPAPQYPDLFKEHEHGQVRI